VSVHHWARIDELVKTPHLWMGDTLYALPTWDGRLSTSWRRRARNRSSRTCAESCWRRPRRRERVPFGGSSRYGVFRELDERILALNRKGIVVDLMLAWDQSQLAGLFPDWAQRERYVRYLVARYAAMDITWQGFANFEHAPGGRARLRRSGWR